MVVSQLSPSGDVRVCPDAVVEITCNVSHSTRLITWTIVQPMSNLEYQNLIETDDLPEIGVPIPHSLPGINVTLQSVTNTSIVTSLTIDTSNYIIAEKPILVTCSEPGQAEIINPG